MAKRATFSAIHKAFGKMFEKPSADPAPRQNSVVKYATKEIELLMPPPTPPRRSVPNEKSTKVYQMMMKPHIPMIRFPKREPLGEINIGTGNPNSLEALITENITPAKPAPATVGSKKPKGPSADSSELPLRFRRKLISSEEMEFIEKGGPV